MNNKDLIKKIYLLSTTENNFLLKSKYEVVADLYGEAFAEELLQHCLINILSLDESTEFELIEKPLEELMSYSDLDEIASLNGVSLVEFINFFVIIDHMDRITLQRAFLFFKRFLRVFEDYKFAVNLIYTCIYYSYTDEYCWWVNSKNKLPLEYYDTMNYRSRYLSVQGDLISSGIFGQYMINTGNYIHSESYKEVLENYLVSLGYSKPKYVKSIKLEIRKSLKMRDLLVRDILGEGCPIRKTTEYNSIFNRFTVMVDDKVKYISELSLIPVQDIIYTNMIDIVFDKSHYISSRSNRLISGNRKTKEKITGEYTEITF